jgi:hypothetical protein
VINLCRARSKHSRPQHKEIVVTTQKIIREAKELVSPLNKIEEKKELLVKQREELDRLFGDSNLS